MAAAAQKTSSSVASCSRHSTGVPAFRAAPISRRHSHVVRVAEPAAAPAAAAVSPFPQQAGPKDYKPLTPEDLTNHPIDPALLKLPPGYHWYETMIVLKAMMDDQSRDAQLAKFEAYLNKENCLHINACVRNRTRLAYPMKTSWDGMYVLYTYAAKRQTARNVQLLLSNPEAGSEDIILRHITFCRM